MKFEDYKTVNETIEKLLETGNITDIELKRLQSLRMKISEIICMDVESEDFKKLEEYNREWLESEKF